jgi:hypothetical protein
MKKIFIYIFSIISVLYIYGCVEDLTGSSSGDTISPSITVSSPKTNDSIGYSSTSITYTASDDQGVSFIELYVDSVYVSHNDGSSPTISLTFDSTKIGKKINYFLIAYDAGGNSAKSNTMYNITLLKGSVIKAAPGAPTNLAAKKLSANVYNLSWTDTSSNVKKYMLYRKVTAAGTYTKIKEIASGTYNVNDDGLDPNSSYYYKICSHNDYGDSPFSNEVSINGGYGSSTVAFPTNLTAQALGAKKVRINWQDNSNNENYFQIERRISWSTDYTVAGVVLPNVVTFTDSSSALAANTEYYYRVKAVSGNDSSWSTDVYVQTFPYDITKPTNLVATNTVAQTVHLTWSDNDYNETQTNIERRTGTSGQFSVIDSVTYSDLKSYDDNTVIVGETYSYRVRQARLSSDYSIYSDYSNTATITITVSPSAPTNLTGVFLPASRNVKLDWSDNSDNETGFVIEKRDSASTSSYTTLTTVGANITEYFDAATATSASSGKTYYYRIRATNGKYSDYSNEIKVYIAP